MKRSYQSFDSPSSPPSGLQQKSMSEDKDIPMQVDPSELPPCELFGNLNQGMCAAHASSLSPQTTFNELSHLSQALGPQNLRRRNFPVVEEENRPLYTVLDPKTKFDKEACRITALCYTDTGELVVADAANSKVKVFNAGGELKVECIIPINFGTLLEPSGVCCAPSGEIIVADKGAGDLKVFTKEGHFLTTFGQDLKKPCDVVVSSQGQVIVVVEGSRKINIFKKLGNEDFSKISGDIKDSTIGGGLRSVGMTSTGNIVVVDETARSVIVYDSFGKFSSIYTSEVPGTKGSVRRPKSLVSSYSLGQLKQPTGVTDDHHGNVFVVDGESGRIAQFDVSNNVFLRQIVSREDGLDKPQRIAVSPTGQLAVTEANSDMLKIYDVTSLLSW